MSARLGLTVGITIAAVIFGGWRMVLPGVGGGSAGVDSSVSSLVSTTVRAAFTGAEANLDAKRIATGSYAGTLIEPPIELVRADGASYCLQYAQGVVLQHLVGPGGTVQPGPC